ncbi:uncharacterized protein LOC143240365 [Tachypleus tridentatus]|uniref:uncharacterized protein LOC143240365 n=1 Tax=Tachypleus tridentatus TaxID=6853 RepID=UPI003FD209D1
MAAIPYAAHTAKKVHENLKKQKHVETDNTKNGREKERGQFQGIMGGVSVGHTDLRNVLSFTPPKYNSKMMDSIWGLYNRYAPHAFQKNSEGSLVGQEVTATPQAKSYGLLSTGWLN